MVPRIIIFLGTIIIIASLVAAGIYFVEDRRTSDRPDGQPTDTVDDPKPADTVTATSTSWKGPALPPPATGSVDTDGWLMYADRAKGFTIEHPPSFIQSPEERGVTFIVPKSQYFHWPRQDDAKVTVLAAPMCQDFAPKGGIAEGAVTESFTVNGVKMSRTAVYATSTRGTSLDVAYEAESDGDCFRVSLSVSGGGSASDTVDDPVLAARYDAEHDRDIAALLAVFSAMTADFRILAR